MIAPDQLVTALATAAFPTFAVLIGILADTNRHIDDARDSLRADIFRMKEHLQR